MASVKQETISGIKWGLIQKFTMQPVQLLFGIALARMISPREFGILGLTAIFFSVANTLRDAGFGSALIRKQDRTEADCSTMFWFNLTVSCLLGGILFLLAPWFADFYGEPDLLWLTRISAFMMCITCTGSVHWTLYTARRDFKTPAIVSMSITLIGMPICLYFAYNGWGIWALVIQQVATQVLSLSVVWIISPWRPRLIWSNDSFKGFFAFGSRLAVTSLLNTIYNELKTFFIGKVYSPADLGLYTKGTALCNTATYTLTGVLDRVIYPILVTLQQDNERLLHVYMTYIRVSALPMLFMLSTCAVNSSNIILFLYGDNWAGAAVFAQIICFSLMCNPLTVINAKMYLIKGRTDLTLKQEIITRCYGLPVLCYTAFQGILIMCYAGVSIAVLALVLSTYTSSKLSGIKQTEIYLSYFSYLALSALANIPAYFVNMLHLHPGLALLINGTSAVLIYGLLLYLKKDVAGGILVRTFLEKVSPRHTKTAS